MTCSGATHQVWPPERFYWAILDAPGFARACQLVPGLRPLLEDEVPVPIDTLHAVAAPLGNDRLLVCAAPRDQLRSLGPEILSLTPQAVPEFAAGADPAAFNLLTGDFQPVAIRRAKSRRQLVAMAACLACATLLSLGLLRRSQHWTAQAFSAHRATAAVLKTAAESSPDSLALDLRHLRASAHPATLNHDPTDAALALASLLASWPSQVPSKPQSLTVNASGIAVAVTVERDPSSFLKAFRAPSGYTQDEPRINTAGATTRVNLQLRPRGHTP